MEKNFAIIGCGGYIAPRHLRAIKETGNKVIAALDKSDSVGILDKYFDDVEFFTEFERLDRHAEKLRRKNTQERIHIVSICSPNYLHDAHTRFAFRIGANAICEKPLVLNPWNLDQLIGLEQETGQRVYCIMQLRHHPSLIELKRKIENERREEKYNMVLTYITPRGKWYNSSWKGDVAKSGGLATNLGIHFFDMLMWIFGDFKRYEVHCSSDKKVGGYLELERARVSWFLSIDRRDLPNNANGTYRSLLIDGRELEFSEGFNSLHTEAYRQILQRKGFGINAVKRSIELTHRIRNSRVSIPEDDEIHCLSRNAVLSSQRGEEVD